MSETPATAERREGELWFALGLLVFALAAFWQAYGISGFSSPSSAGVFPMLAAGTMVLAALYGCAATLRKPAPKSGSLRVFFAEILPARLIVFIAAIVGFLLLMPYLGFMPAAGIFLFVTISILWRRGILAPAIVTAIALCLIYVTFRMAFQIVLPRGSLIPALL